MTHDELNEDRVANVDLETYGYKAPNVPACDVVTLRLDIRKDHWDGAVADEKHAHALIQWIASKIEG